MHSCLHYINKVKIKDIHSANRKVKNSGNESTLLTICPAFATPLEYMVATITPKVDKTTKLQADLS
jgi:hypothetical protein